ncbi:MAG: hypothetical protein JJT89_02125 [Nitriliruptoraceae bacterium]|nr:hypothetical protein [Nitriliruptoraceae bacterium]
MSGWQPPEPDPIVALTDDERLQSAITARSAARERRDRAAEVATWIGSLRDLAERSAAVVVRVAGDRVHRGALVAVGIDHLAVRLESGAVVLVAEDTVRSVRPEVGSGISVALGDRERAQDRTLVEALQLLYEDARTLTLVLRDVADPLPGRLVALGEDVVSVRPAEARSDVVFVPIAAIAEAVIPA